MRGRYGGCKIGNISYRCVFCLQNARNYDVATTVQKLQSVYYNRGICSALFQPLLIRSCKISKYGIVRVYRTNSSPIADISTNSSIFVSEDCRVSLYLSMTGIPQSIHLNLMVIFFLK